MRTNKSIGLWSAISIGVGGMVGAGIFSIIGVATQISGNAVYISFIIAGLVALLSTYSYAKLGAKYPSAGGPVEFLIRGFGDNVISGGFNILLWVGYVFALALYARAFGGYAKTFLPANAPMIYINIFATGIILFFTAVNFIGAKAVGKSELFIVSIKVGILTLFAIVGFFFIDPSRLTLSQWPQSSNILFGAALVFLAYEGFGLITNAAEDMENPQKTLPKALYLSVIFVILIYVSVSLVVIGNLSIAKIIKAEDYALAEAAKPFFGLLGFKLIAIAALFSTSSAINATLYGGANVSYFIAKEGELPEIFERKVWGRSTEGLLITAALVLLFTNLFALENIAMLGSACFLLIYGAVNIAHFRLYRETGAKAYLIWTSVVSCFIPFFILVYYEIIHSPMTLFVIIVVVVFSFTTEFMFQKFSQRTLKTRNMQI